MLARVARRYDGWLPYLPDPAAYARAWQTIQQQATRAVTPAMYATIVLDTDSERAQTELEGNVRQYYRRSLMEMSTIQAYFGGTAEDCADWLTRYLDAGATHLILRLGSLNVRRQLDLVAENLLPALRSRVAT